jgi:hypothetical protein
VSLEAFEVLILWSCPQCPFSSQKWNNRNKRLIGLLWKHSQRSNEERSGRVCFCDIYSVFLNQCWFDYSCRSVWCAQELLFRRSWSCQHGPSWSCWDSVIFIFLSLAFGHELPCCFFQQGE